MEENNDELIIHIENPKISVQKVESKKTVPIKWILNQVRYKINTWKLMYLFELQNNYFSKVIK